MKGNKEVPEKKFKQDVSENFNKIVSETIHNQATSKDDSATLKDSENTKDVEDINKKDVEK